MISPSTVQKIKDTMRVEEVIGDYVNLKRRGSNLIGLCPLHGEKTPSFNVNPARGIFKCFGCGEGGDAISFVQRHDSIGYVEALRLIARKYNITIEETELSEEVRAEHQKAQALSLVNDFARDYYHEQLTVSEEGKAIGLSYFKHRGYTDETIKKFELGFAPPRGDALKQAALAKGFQRDFLKELGLITKDGSRDFLRDRVVFPIHGYSGKVVAFAGRILKSNTKAPKYLNSPETELYNKSKILYGMHLAKSSVRREDHCLITEGYADVIALHQAGIENVVATSGTSLTSGHIRIIKRLTQKVIFLYDGDKAGIKAALRGLDMVLSEGMEVKLVLLPDNHDPDSYVKENGGEAFREYVKAEAKDFIGYKADLVEEEAMQDPIARANLVQDVLKSVAMVPDPILRAEYTRTIGTRFSLDEATLVQSLNNYLSKRYEEERRKERVAQRNISKELAQEAIPPPTEERRMEAPGTDDYPIEAFIGDEQPSIPKQPVGQQHVFKDVFVERDIVSLLVRFSEQPFDEEADLTVADYLCAGLEEVLDTFEDKVCGQIARDCHGRQSRGESIGPDYWTKHSNDEVRAFAATVLTDKYVYSEGWFENFEISLTTQKMPELNWLVAAKRSIIRFKLTKLLRKMDQTTARMRTAQEEGDEKAINRLLKLYSRMEAVKKQLSAELGSVVLR
jgi:DNA primase